MATDFTLHIISAKDITQQPSLALRNDDIANWITRASQGEVSFRVVRHPSSQLKSDGVDAASLQLMFQEFVTSPGPGQVARNIALILCRDWIVKGALNGLMFDYDGEDPFLRTRFQSEGTPREACAIFMNPLSAHGDDFISRTALHELGHVFNLRHDFGGSSFMSTPIPGTGYKTQDGAALARAGARISPDDLIHLPGLSNFDDMHPNLIQVSKRKRSRKGPRQAPLELRVWLAKDRYLLGEIVTLQLQLRIRHGQVNVPCQLDPGYEALRIWYETPLGERRLYRPFVRMCASRSSAALVTVQKPLMNNPRISVGNRGVVFRHPGRYGIWAEFAIAGAEKPIVSSRFEFEVRMPRRDQERHMTATLTRPDVARFLAQKGGVLSAKSRRELIGVAQRYRQNDATKHARYALAHQFARTHHYKRAREVLGDMHFRLESLQEGLERLRASVSPQQS